MVRFHCKGISQIKTSLFWGLVVAAQSEYTFHETKALTMISRLFAHPLLSEQSDIHDISMLTWSEKKVMF